jgi:hypothetical protein
MIRTYLISGLVGAMLAAVAYAYFTGARNAADKAESESLKSTIESGEQFNEGAANPDACGWFDRLREACPAD